MSYSSSSANSQSDDEESDLSGSSGFRLLRRIIKEDITSLESRPFPRSGHRVVASDKYVVVIGGYNPRLAFYNDDTEELEDPILKDVWMFNLITKRWTEVKCHQNDEGAEGADIVPRHLASHSAVLHDNYILVFGGSSYPFGSTSSNDLYALKVQSEPSTAAVWRRLDATDNSKPPKQYGHAMLLHDKRLYIIGGTSGYQFNMKVYELALDEINLAPGELKWKSLLRGPECMPRYRHEAFFLDGKLMVLGGGTSDRVCALDRVDVFDFINGLWSSQPTSADPTHGFPAPRRCHGLAQRSDNGSVYISGGTNSPSQWVSNSNCFDDIWILHPNLSWQKFEHNLPESMYFHAMAITPNCTSLLVFGGVVKHEARSGEIYRCWLKPPSLKELALSVLVDCLSNGDLFETLDKHLEKLGVPKNCLDWVNGVWL